MSEFGLLTLVLAGLLLVVHGAAMLKPAATARALRVFPRNKIAGWVLATLALVWAGWLVYKMPLGRFDHLKPWLFLVTPGVIFGTYTYMEELLAVRALGGLLLLYPAPVLAQARLSDSDWSVVMSLVCYALVIKGMLLVLNPWMFRKGVAWLTFSDWRLRLFGIIGTAFDLLLIVLAVGTY